MPVAAGQPGVGGVAWPCEEAQGATLSPHHLPLAALRVGVRTPVEVGTPRPSRERPHRVSFSKWHQGRPHPCPPASPSAASSIGLGPQTPCWKQESSGQPSRSPGSALVGGGCSWLYWKWRGRGEGSACLRANPRVPGWPRGLAGCPSPRQAAVHLQVPDPSCSCGQWPVWQGLGTGLLGRDPHPAGALYLQSKLPFTLSNQRSSFLEFPSRAHMYFWRPQKRPRSGLPCPSQDLSPPQRARPELSSAKSSLCICQLGLVNCMRQLRE